MSRNAQMTADLLHVADKPIGKQVQIDLASGYLRWQYDDSTAALVTLEGRVAIILYPAAPGEPFADFETADWYAERVEG